MSESIDDLRALLEQQQERIEALEQQQTELQKRYQATKEQNEQVLNLFEQFKTGSISRRAFLTSVSAVAGISWLAGSADAAPNWSNASGNSGTESKPLKNVYAQNGTLQSLSTDDLDVNGSLDSTKTLLDAVNASGDLTLKAKETTVEQTDTTILSLGAVAGVAWVLARTQDSTTYILDRVGFAYNSSPQRQNILSVSNPATPSYSRGGGSGLQLSMSSGTYETTAVGFQLF